MASFVHAGSAALPALRLLGQDTIVYTRAADAHTAPVSGLLPLSTAAPSGLSSTSLAAAASAAGSSGAQAGEGSGAAASTSTSSIPPTQPTISYRQAVSPASYAFDISPSANLVVGADVRSPTLLFWTLRSDALLQRIIVPTRLTALALNPARPDLLAAGSGEGSLFLWRISTGELLASFDAHYRAVTALTWSSDGGALVSGGADSRILVWALAGLLAPEGTHRGGAAISAGGAEQPLPYATLTDHTLPITSLAFPPSARFPAPATMWSTSLDGSLKLWDMRTRSLLYTYSTPFPLQHVVCDPLNRFVYVSTAPPQAASAAASTSASNALHQVSRVIRIDVVKQRQSSGTEYLAQEEAENQDVSASADGRIYRVGPRITSLALSPASSHLLVGTVGSQVHVYDASSAQMLSVLNLGPSIVNSSSSSSSATTVSNGGAGSSAPSLKAGGGGGGGALNEVGSGPGACFAPGAITNLKIVTLAPVQSRMSAALGSGDSTAGGVAKGRSGGEDDAVPIVAPNFGRTVVRPSLGLLSRGGDGDASGSGTEPSSSGGVVWRRIPRDLDRISPYICPPTSLFPVLKSGYSGLFGEEGRGSIQLPLPGLFPAPPPSSSSQPASTLLATDTTTKTTGATEAGSRQAELEAEVVRLRTQLEEASRLNERLYALVGGQDGSRGGTG